MVVCPVCGSSQVYGDGKWKVCSNCGLEFKHPASVPNYHKWNKTGFRTKQMRRATRQAEYLKEHGIETVLDVGCGCGCILEIMDGAGVEPSKVRKDGMYADLSDLPDGTYDCAMMSHVLEHLPSPVSMLKELHGFSDRLYIEVPEADNRSAKRAPGHILVFDKYALKRTLEYGRWHVDEIVKVDDELRTLCSTIT